MEFGLRNIILLLLRNVNLSTPASLSLFISECDVNCHKKCEKLTANLCGVNQKLIVEALSSVRRGIIDFIIIGQWEKSQEIKISKKSSLSSGDAWSLTDNLSFFLRFKNPRLTRWILFSFFKFVTFKAIDRAYKYSPNLKLVAFKRKYDGRDSWFPQSLCY